jgi:GxxExxY protein
MYIPTEVEEKICKEITHCAYIVHSRLGPGLLEKIYETCFCHELDKKGIRFQRQVVVPICYDHIIFDEGVRIDVLVEDCIICELKAVEAVNPVFQAQVFSYLKMTSNHVGFLINFNVPLIKHGIRRFCLK